MKTKEQFKEFVKMHPELVSYVKSGEMTWQKFFELYSLYDDDNNIWNEYIKKQNNNISDINNINSYNNNSKSQNFTEIFNLIKNIKPDIIQQNITSLQKFLGFISDLISDNKNNNDTQRNIYTPRPTHKMFED